MAPPNQAATAIYAVLWDSEHLIDAFNERRLELGLSMEELDELSGYGNQRRASKYLSPGRTKGLSVDSIFKLLKGMGFRLVLEVDPKATQRILDDRKPLREENVRSSAQYWLRWCAAKAAAAQSPANDSGLAQPTFGYAATTKQQKRIHGLR